MPHCTWTKLQNEGALFSGLPATQEVGPDDVFCWLADFDLTIYWTHPAQLQIAGSAAETPAHRITFTQLHATNIFDVIA